MSFITTNIRFKLLNAIRTVLLCSLVFAFAGATVFTVKAWGHGTSGGGYETTSKAFSASAEFVITDDCNLEPVIGSMEDLGYSVTPGYFEPYDEETSQIYIPFAYDNTDYLVAHFQGNGDETSIRCGGQDILLLEVPTPSAFWYFSLGAYSAATITAQNGNNDPIAYTVLEASLGDPLNPANYDTGDFNDPFTARSFIAVTADEVSRNDIVNALTDAGLLTDNNINLQVIPQSLFRFSDSDDTIPRDTLAYIWRMTKTREPHPDGLDFNFRDAFLIQDFPFLLFQKPEVDPREPIDEELLDPTPPYHQVKMKRKLKPKFKNLVRNVVRNFERDYGLQFVSSRPFVSEGGMTAEGHEAYIFEHGEFCIENEKDCMFDKRDSHYSWDKESHLLGYDDYYLLIGVDPTRLGMAELSQAATWYVEDPDNGNPFKLIESLSNKELEEYSIPEVVKIKGKSVKRAARKSFMVQITRPENAIDGIASMAYDTDALSEEQHFIVTGELTLNPKTGTRPDDKQVIPWQLLHFKKVPPAP